MLQMEIRVNLFTYGTLMAPDIMREVSGTLLESVSVTLSGYQRFQVQGEQYPGIISEAGQKVTGILYLNVPADAVKRLDLFEGEMYNRIPVSVARDSDGETVSAMAYVFKDEYAHRLSTSAWDFENFLQNGKQLFEDQYGGFNDI